MKSARYLIALLLLSAQCAALSIGVVPDRLEFEGGGDEAAFRIVNPNDESIEFEVKSNSIDCLPTDGNIERRGSTDILCIAQAGAEEDLTILVETSAKESGAVGIIPAVAIKARIGGRGDEKGDISESDTADEVQDNEGEQDLENRGEPLTITGQTAKEAAEPAAVTEDSGKDPAEDGMKAKLATIAFLATAIICVLAYSEIKKRRKKKTLSPSPSASSKGPPQEQGQNTHQENGHP